MDNLDVANKTILCVGAHADDIDFICGGSVAKWAGDGAKIYYVVCTDGRKGSQDVGLSMDDLVEIRIKEQKAAAQILGAQDVMFLDFIDGELENTLELKKALVKIIRQLKPDIVVTWDPTYVYNIKTGTINHPDHRNCGQAVMDSVYPFARNLNTFPELLKENLMPHKVRELLLINQNTPNFFVNIADTMNKKIKALIAHDSQFEKPDGFKNAMEWITNTTKDTGEKADCEHAEGFVRISIKF